MPSLTLYGGIDEIGGNKILLEDKGTRVFFDFGKSFNARSKFYEWTEKPRLANGIGDFLALGILPDIRGIYRDDLVKLARLPPEKDRFVDALVLSHAHSDHADHISFLREDIPIYMGQTTRDIICGLEEERSANVEFEITNFKKRPSDRKSDPVEREIHTFRTGSNFSIDSIEIEPVHVDHSLPGCYGFIIRTSSSTIIYSGDLRIHGNKSDLTRDFVERAKDAKPDLMLCEGTRINESFSMKESDVFQLCLEYIMQLKDHFVFADYSYKDLDRFTTFYNIAKRTGRKIVINPKTARYLQALAKNPTLDIPKIEDESIVVYKPRVKSGGYLESDYDSADGDLFQKNANVWTSEDIKKNESSVIMTLGSYQIEELIDIRPSGGIYLHSASEPFNEEGEIDLIRMSNWMERFGLAKLHAHCSGHASGRDINFIINEVNPSVLVPIHTEHPELFKTLYPARIRVGESEKPIEV